MKTWPLSRHVALATLDPRSSRSLRGSGCASPRAAVRRSRRRGSCASGCAAAGRGRRHAPGAARTAAAVVGRAQAPLPAALPAVRDRARARPDPDRARAARRRRARRRCRCRPSRSARRRSRGSRPLEPDAVAPARGGSSSVMPEVVWRDSISLGLPYHGRLIDGVQLPAQSPLWTTWDPALDRVPDRGYRRYGSAKLIHLLLSVAQAYHEAHPGRPAARDRRHQPLRRRPARRARLASERPRRRRLLPAHRRPRGRADDDRAGRHPALARPAQPLLAANPEFVFVGPHLPLHGPAGVVEPLVGHDNHMHVRIFPPELTPAPPLG